jgi:hypothetical protein
MLRSRYDSYMSNLTEIHNHIQKNKNEYYKKPKYAKKASELSFKLSKHEENLLNNYFK